MREFSAQASRSHDCCGDRVSASVPPVHGLEWRILMPPFGGSILPPQPPIPAFGDGLQPAPQKPGSTGFSRIRLCLQATDLSISGEELPKVSSRTCENSRFVEIFGADRFEHECRPTVPGVRIPLAPPSGSAVCHRTRSTGLKNPNKLRPSS